MVRSLTLYVGATLALLACLASPLLAQDITIEIRKKPQEPAPFTGDRPAVDVAVLLDTSNSMDGLINQAKSQLWKIVQQFAAAEKAGKTPLLRVSIFEYGNTGLPAKEGYIRQVVPLTDNLDEVSAGLFQLTTNGGDEYCGMVIDEALKRLDWNKEPNAYKVIFIAGNEPFTQGPVSYTDACRKAIESGVVVNTIHCGDYQAGISGMWQQGAQLAEGEYMNINQDRKVVHIPTPQDKIIIQLNSELNKTYLWYGQKNLRQRFESSQIAQDANAAQAGGGGGFSGRVAAKASKVYRNVGRDLVDTWFEDKSVLDKVPAAELPEAMQKMKPADRAAHLKKMAEQRAALQKKIGELNRTRQAYIAKVQKEKSEASGEATLGDAITTAVVDQLKKSGFKIRDAAGKQDGKQTPPPSTDK